MIQSQVRCDRHVGDPYPPRCEICESLAREYELLRIPATPPLEKQYPVYKKREEIR